MNPRNALVLLIFFASGAAGLMYEVLWMKELKLLFGSTAHSVATATAAFFLGIAAGSYFWGERLRSVRRPLRTYAWLELGIVCGAAFFHVALAAWDAFYPVLFDSLSGAPRALTFAKLLLSMSAICPAAFLMGGTLPVMGQYLVRSASELGRWSGWLYATNTFGAALGALLAGFLLPRAFGFDGSYLITLCLSFGVALIAFGLSVDEPEEVLDEEASLASVDADAATQSGGSLHLLSALACLSGFATLALQVLWTRMFVQVLQNSVYTFSAILAVFLLALALGAVLARLLTAKTSGSATVLAGLLLAAGLVVLTVPFAFFWWTNGLSYIATRADFGAYLAEILLAVALLVGVPTCLLGVLLPFLYRFAEHAQARPGVIIGRLNGWNTLGAVGGSLVAGFVLLEWLGLWSSVRFIGSLYLLAAVLVLARAPKRARPLWFYGAAASLLLPVSFFDPGQLDKVRLRPVTRDEALVDLIEGSSGTVAVIRQGDSLRIKLDNWYSLGGSGAARMEAMQTHLPFALHPEPQGIFYLGLGTGITAGASVQYPVRGIVVAELVDEVISASRRYFEPYTEGLYEDARVRVVNEDGRNFLRASRDRFDLVIADLFIPWRSGVAYLYTVDHFEAARERLAPGGLYVQWIPLYQTSDRELGIIARSMLEAFPRVTAWRGDFESDRPMIALIGHGEAAPLPRNAPIVGLTREAISRLERGEGNEIPLLAHYLGTLDATMPWIAESRVNTEDRPWIEYLAPESHREVRAGNRTWLVGDPLMVRMRALLERVEPSQDPYLARLDPLERRAVYAGYYIHLAAVARANDEDEAAAQATARARRLLSD